jgi:hypothetical protein
LTKEQLEKVEEKIWEMLVNSDPDMKECICGHKFSAVQGKVDYGYKDEQGNVLSKDAAEHLSKFRYNCPQCHMIFCSGCKV